MSGVIVVATRNKGKVKEIAEMYGRLGKEVRSLADYEGIPEIEETGTTFLENALIKAETVAKLLGVPVLADDSGLEVEALNGEPGVYSARYAGVGAHDADNNAKLQQELAARLGQPAEELLGPGHPPVWSPAAFVCAIVLYDPERNEAVRSEGRCEGYIVRESRGSGGFGYDPYFYVPEFGRTMGELSLEEKNRISHRAQALQGLLQQQSQ